MQCVFRFFLLQNLLQISNVPILLFSTNQKFLKEQNTVYCNILYCTALCSMSCVVLQYLCRMPSNSIVKVSSAKNAVLGDAQLVILGLLRWDSLLLFRMTSLIRSPDSAPVFSSNWLTHVQLLKAWEKYGVFDIFSGNHGVFAGKLWGKPNRTHGEISRDVLKAENPWGFFSVNLP